MSTEKAVVLHEQGRLGEAEACYRAALADNPACHEALHGLGLVMHQRGRHDLAAALTGSAVELCPGRADYRYHLAEVLRCAGRYGDAVVHYREAIRREPGEADYYFGLGNALAARGENAQAIRAYQEAVRLAPGDAEIHNNLGNVLADKGNLEAALKHLHTAVRIEPRYADAHHNLALLLHERGARDKALAHAQKARRLAPCRVEVVLSLAGLLEKAGDTARAASVYRQALDETDPNADALARIGDGLRRAGEPQAALVAYRRAALLAPGVASHRAQAGHCLTRLNRFEEAEDEANAALEVDPDSAQAHLCLAVCRQSRGHFQQGNELLRRVLELDPAMTEAAYLLTADGSRHVSDDELENWSSLERRSDLSDAKRIRLCFALGRAHDKRGEYASAFKYYERANQIKFERHPFDPRRNTEYVRRIMAEFTAEFFESRQGFGLDDSKLVFVVGMPRSGSTLVEQILARHPQVAAAGEHMEMREIVRNLPASIGSGKAVPECCRELTEATAAALARRYLESLPEPAARAVRVADKMLGNFLRLGVIALLFPGARVVHCVRDPMDTCVSCFTQDFAHGLRFTTNLSHLASFYRDYRSLMAHWRSVLPLPILDVSYESLVNDPESVSRSLIRFCGLPWDERCLSPHLARRKLATASVWQARQPVYSSSVGRWRRYEPFLGPLVDGLERTGAENAH